MRGVVAVLLAALGGLAACKPEPSLRVEVVHPEELTSDTARNAKIVTTTIVVYEAESLTCAAIEFGDIAGAQLDVLEVARFTVDGAGSGAFDNVFSRTTNKAVVARGFSATNELVAADCVEVKVVGEGERITLTTIPAATVSVIATEDIKSVVIAAVDPLDRPASGRAVSWRVFGPAGTSVDETRFTNVADGVWEPKRPTCTDGGEAIIHPAHPTVQGAFALQTRFSWAKDRPPLFTQVTDVPTLPSNNLETQALRPCALRKVGNAKSLVCLEAPRSAREYTLSGASLMAGATAVVGQAGDTIVGLVSIENGGDRDVYGLTSDGGWIAVFGAPAPGNGRICVAGTCTITDFEIAPACGASSALLVAKLDDGAIRKVGVKGMGVPMVLANTGPGATVGNAGCLAELLPNGTMTLRQAIVIEGGDAVGAAGRVFYECAADTNGCVNPLFGEGVGFTGAPDHQMIISSFDATGTVLSTVVAVPAQKPNPITGRREDRFIERARQPSAAPPAQLVVGNFDGDTKPDLLWHFQAARTSAIQLAYAQKVDNKDPITALLPIDRSTVVDLLVADLDSDGRDEAIFVVDSGTPVTRQFQVARLGMPNAGAAPPEDPECPCDDPPCL